MKSTRRQFIRQSAGLAAGAALLSQPIFAGMSATKPSFSISLAQWSLHRTIRTGKLDTLDFPAEAKNKFGISIVEYVNQFFKDKANDSRYLAELLKRCTDNGVVNHLIMCDGEGNLGDTDAAKRKTAVDNHHKWVDAAKYLGCVSIRVNAAGTGTREEVAKAAAEGLSSLGGYADKVGINVIVENHGGYSSDGSWLAGVMTAVNHPRIGTLPDFGNFCIRRGTGGKCDESYDRYKGTKELMPFAKGVSAKTYDFDEQGNCVETDYDRIMKLVKDSGFTGIVGIEYEGNKLSEEEGIKKTKMLLERFL